MACSKPAQPNPENPVRMLLVGKTGSGKSSSGNTILQREAFDTSSGFASCTPECRLEDGTVNNTPVQIMDTPGLFDTTMGHADTCVILLQFIINLHPGPDVILYVIKYGDRYGNDDYEAFCQFKTLLGSNVTDHMVILITRGDVLEEEQKDIEEALANASDQLKKVIDECGKRYIVIDNKARNKQGQLTKLHSEVSKLRQANGWKPFLSENYAELREKLNDVEKLKEELRKQNPSEQELEQIRLEKKHVEQMKTELETLMEKQAPEKSPNWSHWLLSCMVDVGSHMLKSVGSEVAHHYSTRYLQRPQSSARSYSLGESLSADEVSNNLLRMPVLNTAPGTDDNSASHETETSLDLSSLGTVFNDNELLGYRQPPVSREPLLSLSQGLNPADPGIWLQRHADSLHCTASLQNSLFVLQHGSSLQKLLDSSHSMASSRGNFGDGFGMQSNVGGRWGDLSGYPFWGSTRSSGSNPFGPGGSS